MTDNEIEIEQRQALSATIRNACDQYDRGEIDDLILVVRPDAIGNGQLVMRYLPDSQIIKFLKQLTNTVTKNIKNKQWLDRKKFH